MIHLPDATFSSSQVVNIEDLRRLARRRVSRAVFDYLDGGADREITLRENCSAFEEIYLRPSSALAFEHVDLGVRILGRQLTLPFLLAPVGYSWLMHPEGELAAARAAGDSSTAPRVVLIGRAYAYGMAAAGYPGIERANSILRADLERTARLLGCQTVSRLNPAYVTTPADWHR